MSLILNVVSGAISSRGQERDRRYKSESQQCARSGGLHKITDGEHVRQRY